MFNFSPALYTPKLQTLSTPDVPTKLYYGVLLPDAPPMMHSI